jgi:hypothetical protein
MEVIKAVNSTPKNTDPLVMTVRQGFLHKFRHAMMMFFIFSIFKP